MTILSCCDLATGIWALRSSIVGAASPPAAGESFLKSREARTDDAIDAEHESGNSINKLEIPRIDLAATLCELPPPKRYVTVNVVLFGRIPSVFVCRRAFGSIEKRLSVVFP